MSQKFDAEIEQEIQNKGLTAARVRPSDIDARICDSQFHVFPGTTVTVCCLTLTNGFNVVGKSAAVSMANFDETIGRKVAFEDARNKIWELEGYLLCDKVHQDKQTTKP